MRILFFIIAFGFAGLVCAQDDPVLLKINNREFSRSEFEYAYNKKKTSESYSKKRADDFLKDFINEKLKVIEAEVLKLDTTPAFRSDLSIYRRQLWNELFMSGMTDKVNVGNSYEQMKAAGESEQVAIMQILKRLPQSSSHAEQEQASLFMKSLFAELKNNPGTDFSACVNEHSDDKRVLLISRRLLPLEFEEVAFSLSVNEVSSPFLTSQGIHIIKVLERGYLTPHEEDVRSRFMKKQEVNAGYSFLQQLKEEYIYIPNQNCIEELLITGKANGVLFILNGRKYTDEDFNTFAEASPKGVKRQFDDYVTKCVFDCDSENLERKHPEYSFLIRMYCDEVLLAEITKREIEEKAHADKAGLTAFFQVNKKKYKWKQPRFKGVVVHSQDEKVFREIKKTIKNRPEKEWATVIEKRYNTGETQLVQVDQGVFSEGENAFVDKLVFKKTSSVSSSLYPFAAVFGRKTKTPDSYLDVLSPLEADYQKFLESLWLNRLQNTYRVEINEEVLKTVNNH